MRRLTRWAPIAAVVAIAISVALVSFFDDPQAREPIDVRATSAHFETIDELMNAADLIVEGEVVAIDDGRVVGDPSDPSTGIRTRLTQVEVERVGGKAATPAIVIVEQEASLVDGTPITVNGVAPLELGERAILLLVRGESERFPYTTPLNEQAVFLVGADDTVVAGDPDGAIGSRFHDRPAPDLRAALHLEDVVPRG